jgi:hypothetical protein
MDRRTFLVRLGGTLVAVPMVLEAVACGSSSPTQPTDRFSVDSSVTNNHAHSITLLCSQLSGGNNVEYTSSSSGSHSHKVQLTGAQLQTIQTGGQIDKDSIADATGHVHSWSIRKPAGVC